MLAKLTEHVINEAKIGGRLGMNDAPATSVIGRAKQAMQIVSLLSSVMTTKEKELQELSKDKKRQECRTSILEKEKLLLQQ